MKFGRRRRVVVVAALAVMLAATACGGNGDDASGLEGTADVVVAAHDFSFDPEQITVEKGAAVALSNEGAMVHDLTVEGTDVKITADPEQETTGEIELEPGTYTFYCSIPGHRESGMEGSLVVKN